MSCLRQQLNGDELLTWTIETFTMFYDKTWAQSFALPLLGLIPLFFSILTFVYDYYSDFQLSYEYYQNAYHPTVCFIRSILNSDILLELSILYRNLGMTS